MKKAFWAVALMGWLTGCSFIQSTQESPAAKARVTFSGAKNDLMPGPSRYTVAFDVTANAADETVWRFPLSDFVECDDARSYCEHGVVKSFAVARLRNEGSDVLLIDGTLQTEIGRTKTIQERGYKEVRAVPDEVPTVKENSSEKPFQFRLKVGEQAEIQGLGGVLVKVSR